jgi:HEAT repeat protein
MERGQAGGADRCREGSALVEVTLGAEGVTDVRFLGPDERPSVGARDLGRVSAAESAEAFLQVARADAAVSADAIVAAVVADSVVIWPDLLDLARHRAHPDETRRSALFWLGQEAASAVTAALLETADDDEEGRQIREAAVFALSQRPAGESLPALRALAQEAEHADTRRSALFWLAQSDDPAVPDFFADILAGP